MDIVLFGKQGSGKGTQGKYLIEKFDLELFETGARLRKFAQENSEIGRRIKEILATGNLVSDEVMATMIRKFIEELPENKNILFDGFPRTLAQNHLLEKLLTEKGREFKAIYIDISDQEALNRLYRRRICSTCKKIFSTDGSLRKCDSCGGEIIRREDDTEQAISIRLQNYRKNTLPIIEEYRSQNKLIVINGEQAIELVRTEILNQLS